LKKLSDFTQVKGFTLLELLIVIAFVAIIMAIGIPNFSKWKEKYEINFYLPEREVFQPSQFVEQRYR